MTGRWLAVVLMWASGGATIVGSAVAWGAQGRGTVLVLGIVFAFALFASTGIIATQEKDRNG